MRFENRFGDIQNCCELTDLNNRRIATDTPPRFQGEEKA